MLNFNEEKLYVTLKRIRFVTYVVMGFTLLMISAIIGFGVAGVELSFGFENGKFHSSTVNDLRPFADRALVVLMTVLAPVLLFFGGVQIVLFTECFTRTSVRRAEASRFARNAGIITIVYMITQPLIALFAHLLDISLFIIRKVPWTNATKINFEFSYQGNVVLLSLMLAFMLFLVSYLLKVDENVQKKERFVAAE